MARIAKVWQVEPGCIEEYTSEHARLPEALEAEIRRQGVTNFSIFHHPDTNQLFAYYEEPDEPPADPPTVAGEAAAAQWRERMAPLLVMEDGSPVEAVLREVFHLS